MQAIDQVIIELFTVENTRSVYYTLLENYHEFVLLKLWLHVQFLHARIVHVTLA